MKSQWPNFQYQARALQAFIDDQGLVVIIKGFLVVILSLDDKTNLGLHLGFLLEHLH